MVFCNTLKEAAWPSGQHPQKAKVKGKNPRLIIFSGFWSAVSIIIRIFAVWIMEEKKSIYQLAAEWGIPFGLYLTCIAMSMIFADWFMPLNLISIILMLCTPLVVYYFQRRKFIIDDGFTEHAGLWMPGIMLFILGTVLASLFVYLVLTYVRPNFMYEQAQAAIKAYQAIPEWRDGEVVKTLQMMIDKRMMPTPIESVFNAFWFITFGGSVLSAITAAIARRTIKSRRHNRQQ